MIVKIRMLDYLTFLKQRWYRCGKEEAKRRIVHAWPSGYTLRKPTKENWYYITISRLHKQNAFTQIICVFRNLILIKTGKHDPSKHQEQFKYLLTL